MPNVRHVLSCLPTTSRLWASPTSGDIRMSPPLGQEPLVQSISQTERALSLRNAMHALVTIFWCAAAQEQPHTCSLPMKVEVLNTRAGPALSLGASMRQYSSRLWYHACLELVPNVLSEIDE